MKPVAIKKTIRSKPPRLSFTDIKNEILGTQYELSLVFVGETRAKTLNQSYRKKDYVPNVLSFPLDNKTGEMFICPKVAAREARRHRFTSTTAYIGFLFIHGCLHLKGLDHGATMEKQERRYLKTFKLA